MEIQGKVISISHAPAIVRENKTLKAEIVGLKWLIKSQEEEIEEFKKTVSYYKGVVTHEGRYKDKQKREKMRKARQNYLRTRRGWVEPEKV